jgi:hypothetical protein
MDVSVVRGFSTLAALIAVTAGHVSPANAASAPACRATPYRAMDFAIGTWTARDANGKVLGVGTWAPILDGCAMRFTYRGRTSNGTAQDGYDASRGAWQKAWVDDAGDVELSEGHASPNRIVYVGNDYRNGARVGMHRGTLSRTAANRMTYVLATSKDAGTTWSTADPVVYTRS